jgi:hypothetical protein
VGNYIPGKTSLVAVRLVQGDLPPTASGRPRNPPGLLVWPIIKALPQATADLVDVRQYGARRIHSPGDQGAGGSVSRPNGLRSVIWEECLVSGEPTH